MCPGFVPTPFWTAKEDDKASTFGYDFEKGIDAPQSTQDKACLGGTIMSKASDDETFFHGGDTQNV